MTKKYAHPSNDHKADAMRRMENARLEWERQQAEKTAEKTAEEARKLTVVFDAQAAQVAKPNRKSPRNDIFENF